METLSEKLKYKIKECEAAGDDMNDESWNYQVGILITGDDAKEILKHTAQLKADKAELLSMLVDCQERLESMNKRLIEIDKFSHLSVYFASKLNYVIQKMK